MSDPTYYDRLLEHTRKTLSEKQRNASRYSSKLGKNTAPNILSLFLRTPYLIDDQQLPLFFNTAFILATREKSEEAIAARTALSALDDSINSLMNDLLDEAGIMSLPAVSDNKDSKYQISVTTNNTDSLQAISHDY